MSAPRHCRWPYGRVSVRVEDCGIALRSSRVAKSEPKRERLTGATLEFFIEDGLKEHPGIVPRRLGATRFLINAKKDPTRRGAEGSA